MHMKRIFLSTLLVLATIATAFADEVSFLVSAPDSVVVNKRFQVEFQINQKVDSLPAMPDVEGLKILYGPGYSTSTSTEVINGNRTTRHSLRHTYIVVAEREGEVTIPSVLVVVNGDSIASEPLTIKVLPKENEPAALPKNDSPAVEITDEDLFVVASLNRTTVQEQESLLLTYKLYVGIDVENLNFRLSNPELQGVDVKEVEPHDAMFAHEHYNGRDYYSCVWMQYLLTPQQSGEFVVPSLDAEFVVTVPVKRSADPFDILFGNGYSYADVKKTLKSNTVTFTATPRPNRQAATAGAVGEFSIASSISNIRFGNEKEFTFKVTVKGSGNMKQMPSPVIEFPDELDVKMTVVRNNILRSGNDYTGEKIYEYTISPNGTGLFEIPAPRMIYVDSQSGEQRTIEAADYTIEVGDGYFNINEKN